MAMARLLLLSVVVACTTSGALAQGGDENMEKIGSFAPPETSAEENDSVVLPRHLRCDGMCTAPSNEPLLNRVYCSMSGSNTRDD